MQLYYLDWHGVCLSIHEGEMVIGRGVGCELHIDDPTSSRRHAVIRLAGGRLTIRDLNSRNGTFLNGERVVGEEVLAVGDRLQVGVSLFTLGQGELAPVSARRLNLPDSVGSALELVDQGRDWNLPQEATEPHVGTIEIIESLVNSPHAQDEPQALATMVESSIERLLANLERRNASLPLADVDRLLALVDRVSSWLSDGALDAWRARVQSRIRV